MREIDRAREMNLETIAKIKIYVLFPGHLYLAMTRRRRCPRTCRCSEFTDQRVSVSTGWPSESNISIHIIRNYSVFYHNIHIIRNYSVFYHNIHIIRNYSVFYHNIHIIRNYSVVYPNIHIYKKLYCLLPQYPHYKKL